MSAKTVQSHPRALIFLAAGAGSRLRPLTDTKPKCLLQVGKTTIIDILIRQVQSHVEREIVVVCGFRGERLERHLRENHPKVDISFVYNLSYDQDINILSLELGVNTLKKPDNGYTIIETDILLDSESWNIIRTAELTDKSFWITSGVYNCHLTGGIVLADHTDKSILDIAYVPKYDPRYEGWAKMLGIVSVSPLQVQSDRMHRKDILRETSRHYYMEPWIRHLQDLPCVAVDLGSLFAKSFNTIDEYNLARSAFLKLVPEDSI